MAMPFLAYVDFGNLIGEWVWEICDGVWEICEKYSIVQMAGSAVFAKCGMDDSSPDPS